MTLADTSIWVAHFRGAIPQFGAALAAGEICIHPLVIGELATGNLRRRRETLAMLASLPGTRSGSFEECLGFVEQHRLFGRGVGWNDVQLLVAAKLTAAPLWSLDRRLREVAKTLAIAFLPR